MRTPLRCLYAVLLLACAAVPAAAAEKWIEVKTANFTVVSNAGDGTARRMLGEFEQVRAAAQQGFPFARVLLNRPVMIIAARNEETMVALTPQLGGKGDPRRPISMRIEAPDRQYIVLRADAKENASGVNPYLSAYWSYISMTLDASFGGALPFWLTNGLSAVLANSDVKEKQIQFGRAIPPFARRVVQEPMLPLRDLLGVDGSSEYYKDPTGHVRFEAQCWALAHYLFFAVPGPHGEALSAAASLLLKGESSAAALEKAIAPLPAIERDYLAYVRKGKFPFSWIAVESDVSVKKYPTVDLPPAESLAIRAGFLAASGQTAEAAALVAEARAAGGDSVAVLEADAMRWTAAGDLPQAVAAYEKAVSLGTSNFYSYLVVAQSRLARDPLEEMARSDLEQVEKLLAESIRLNPQFGESYATLAATRLRANDAANALPVVLRAASLQPKSSSVYLLQARALRALSRREEALDAARQAQSLAVSARERLAAQAILVAMALDSSPTGSRQPSRGAISPGDVAALASALSSAPAPPANAVRVGGNIPPPAKIKDARPVYPAIAQSARVQGLVILEATIGTDGRVIDARVLNSIPLLDQAAIDAVRQWEFAPTLVDGVAVPVTMTVTVQFTLS